MAFRDTLLANLTVALANTSVSTSSELPFTAGDVPLFTKNMKKLYLDVDQTQRALLFPTLDRSNLYNTETTVTAYLCVDAKNLLPDMATIESRIINSRFSVGNAYVRDCTIGTEYTDDRITYNYQFRFLTI
jgi:hypothetical protein